MLAELQRLQIKLGIARRVPTLKTTNFSYITHYLCLEYLRDPAYVHYVEILAGHGEHVEGTSCVGREGNISHGIGDIVNSLNFHTLSSVLAVCKEEHFARGRG